MTRRRQQSAEWSRLEERGSLKGNVVCYTVQLKWMTEYCQESQTVSEEPVKECEISTALFNQLVFMKDLQKIN